MKPFAARTAHVRGRDDEELLMGRWLGLSAGLLVVLVLVGILVVRSAEHDPDTWHVDPAGTAPTGRPNEALAAPHGTTLVEPDLVVPLMTKPLPELLADLDAVARAEPRVEVLAGDIGTGKITYVQRSAIIGFPDYISVSAIETAAGNGLILWSRSRYGYYDFGVNRARLERWLGAAGLL
jgi:hypothetical protein